MNMLTLALLLLFAGIVLAVLEVFLPSGGLLGIMSAGCFIAGIACAWSHSGQWGLRTLIASLVLIPTLIIVGFYTFPHTPLGRKMMLTPPGPETANATDAENAAVAARTLGELTIGQTGQAGTDLRPGGTGVFDEQRISVVTRGEWIPRGTTIQIAQIEGHRVLVEAT